MIPYDIDPSLHSGEREPDKIDDGFSPPPDEEGASRDRTVEPSDPHLELGIGQKSPF